MSERLQRFHERIGQLPKADKTLLIAWIGLAGLGLIIGGVSALMIVLDASGIINIAQSTAYEFLTLHPTYLFYYWLYLVQIAIMFTLILVYTDGAHLTPAWRGLAWGGFGLVAAGFLIDLIVVLQGTAPTYRADYPLIKEFGTSGALFVLGLILLSLGLLLGAIAAMATAMKPKLEKKVKEWSSVSFASFAWMGLLTVTVSASLYAYLPVFQDVLGMTPVIKNFNYTLSWDVMFHNLHYLPIMGAVLTWYVLAETTTGVKSIFSERFSKIIFTLYLLVVPPTSVYHMFLEPEVSATTKVVGSILALGVSIPTIAVGMLIISSIQACAMGEKGSSGSWFRRLPWGNPSFSALVMAMVSAMAGGVIANVMIQEKFASLLSDTFTIPGYFHFFTVGAVSLAFLGILTQIIPALTGHRLWAPRLTNWMPYLTVLGVYIFGVASVWAGYHGLPRRTLEFSYAGAAPGFSGPLITIMGIGGILMVIGIAVYVTILALTMLRDGSFSLEQLPIAALRVQDAAGRIPWLGLVAFALLFAGILAATIGANALIQSLPILGGGGH